MVLPAVRKPQSNPAPEGAGRSSLAAGVQGSVMGATAGAMVRSMATDLMSAPELASSV